VTRGRQRVLQRRPMNECLPYRGDDGHFSRQRARLCDALPSVLSHDRVRGSVSRKCGERYTRRSGSLASSGSSPAYRERYFAAN
jgi:hypothetical protein